MVERAEEREHNAPHLRVVTMRGFKGVCGSRLVAIWAKIDLHYLVRCMHLYETVW